MDEVHLQNNSQIEYLKYHIVWEWGFCSIGLHEYLYIHANWMYVHTCPDKEHSSLSLSDLTLTADMT